jgi:CheY-like chemotaxis protein
MLATPDPLPAARVRSPTPTRTHAALLPALTANRYEVGEAEDGGEALAKVFSSVPLLIAATRLPFIDGYQLCAVASGQRHATRTSFS